MRPNILMVHNYYQIGGGEHTVFEQEAELLRRHGHPVTAYTRHNDELKGSSVKKALLPFQTLFSLKTYREVRRLIRRERIDVVHCHNTFPLISPSVYYAARREGVPVVQAIHNFRLICANALLFRDGHVCEECLSGSFRPAMSHACYRGSRLQTAVVVAMLKLHRLLGTYRRTGYIFLTPFNREKYRALLPEGTPHIYIKPNFEEIHAQPAPEREIDPFKVIYVGRLEENKGIRCLLEYWKQVPEAYRLHLYGSGPLEGLVREQAEKDPRIRPMGFRPQEEIFADWRTACAQVFPSISYEGFPMTLIESLALAVPVLTCDRGNQAAIIEEGVTGYRYAPEDAREFAEKLEKIRRENPRLKQNCREHYERNYTSEKNYALLMDIYRRLGACGK